MDGTAQPRNLDKIEPTPHPPATVDEIDHQIAADRQLYMTAYFRGHDGEAQYWVYEIARLENLRNIVQRQDAARRKP